MMSLDDAAKERLVEQFRASLDRFDEGSGNGSEDGSGDGSVAGSGAAGTVDLRTLLTEMAVLKNEVRLQARQFRTALDELLRAGQALREQQQLAQREVERARAQTAEAKARAERELLFEVLGLRDRLQAALGAADAWRPSLVQRLSGADRRFVLSLREGTALTLERVDELLSTRRVRPIVAVGQQLDPHRMHAVAVERAPAAAPGVVLRELRRGFLQGGELLRAAEVIVNGKGETS
jgi:molecular chaperone GrpE